MCQFVIKKDFDNSRMHGTDVEILNRCLHSKHKFYVIFTYNLHYILQSFFYNFDICFFTGVLISS